MAARGHYANGKEAGHWEFWSSDGLPEEGEDYPFPSAQVRAASPETKRPLLPVVSEPPERK